MHQLKNSPVEDPEARCQTQDGNQSKEANKSFSQKWFHMLVTLLSTQHNEKRFVHA